MSDPSPFEAPDTTDTGDSWRAPVAWAMKLVAAGLLALFGFVLVLQLVLLVVSGVGVTADWILRVLLDSACWLCMLGFPASALWVGANAIAHPETHGMPVLDRNELRGIYEAHNLNEAADGDPGDYASLSDRELADVHGAIHVNAAQYPALMAAIKLRIESSNEDETDD